MAETTACTMMMAEINCPELFAREDFRAYLNDPQTNIATWHMKGTDVGEYSDVFMTYDRHEGSNSDMPGWDLICETLEQIGFDAGIVRLTNMETD